MSKTLDKASESAQKVPWKSRRGLVYLIYVFSESFDNSLSISSFTSKAEPSPPGFLLHLSALFLS